MTDEYNSDTGDAFVALTAQLKAEYRAEKARHYAVMRGLTWRALHATCGNTKRAAELLGIPRGTLRDRARRWGLR